MKQYAFFFDSNACSGCKACEMACRDKHDLDYGLRWRRVYEVTGGSWELKGKTALPQLVAYNLSMSCNQCVDAPCVKVCPSSAMQKREDGIVFVDTDKCMGCKLCNWACPYDAPQYNEKEGVMTKCDFCRDYVDEGKVPSCVAACPMRVLEFGELEKLKEKHGYRSVFPMPVNSTAHPALVVKPHHSIGKIANFNPEIINQEEVKHA
ncbi:MAG: dimethylsulfoxide reductase subunit B [Bacteroidales bacterium]|nr:dimethylsulfoxide reductase subunit B [Bacteroidales bacterium]MCF8351186.1 dimethylsulfoxide reductase subunit B [Bacteroidales bacterium]MCF8375315.1 dimethylsulfoxide reductase subunit B [Bacteroidales bacterium]MCF8400171.1 dimethylsulfoxide reductase subunit B [Bacteroidales bacterium]